jgi:hypothetical protein
VCVRYLLRKFFFQKKKWVAGIYGWFRVYRAVFSWALYAYVYPRKKKMPGDLEVDFVEEYAGEVFKYLHDIESVYSGPCVVLHADSTVTPKMRTTLVTWLIQIHDELRLENNVLFTAINVLDRFTAAVVSVASAGTESESAASVSALDAAPTSTPTPAVVINKSNYQLVGLTALWLGVKAESSMYIDLDTCSRMSDRHCCADDIVSMEREILIAIGWRVWVPTSLAFLRQYSIEIGTNQEEHCLCKYILELALLEADLLGTRYSLLAAATSYLAKSLYSHHRGLKRMRAWQVTTVYKRMEILPVVSLLRKMHVKACTSTPKSVLYKKYARKAYFSVANIKP